MSEQTTGVMPALLISEFSVLNGQGSFWGTASAVEHDDAGNRRYRKTRTLDISISERHGSNDIYSHSAFTQELMLTIDFENQTITAEWTEGEPRND